jgi:hypothetical protein
MAIPLLVRAVTFDDEARARMSVDEFNALPFTPATDLPRREQSKALIRPLGEVRPFWCLVQHHVNKCHVARRIVLRVPCDA